MTTWHDISAESNEITKAQKRYLNAVFSPKATSVKADSGSGFIHQLTKTEAAALLRIIGPALDRIKKRRAAVDSVLLAPRESNDRSFDEL